MHRGALIIKLALEQFIHQYSCIVVVVIVITKMSTSTASTVNGWCLTSISSSRRNQKVSLRPTIVATSNTSSSPIVPPLLIRNQPVFAAPAPIITPTLVRINTLYY